MVGKSTALDNTVNAEAPAAPDPKRRIRDFSEGSIPNHLVAFSVPMLIGNLLQVLYSVINAIWVGRYLGPDSLAAVSVSTPIIFALIALIIGLTMATTVLVAQAFGARRPDEVARTVGNSLILLTALGAVVTAVGIGFRVPILRLIDTPPEVLDLAASYLAVFLAGLVPQFLYNAASAILRGLGDSQTPLRFLAYSVGLNAVLDPVLIFGLGPLPKMGIAGAALATVIAMIYAAVISLRYLFGTSGLAHYTRESFRLDWRITGLTFRIGLPAGVQQMLVSLSNLVVSSIVNGFGATVVAAFGAGARFDQFSFLPAMSLGMAVTSVVGQNLGAGKIKRVNETVKWAVLITGGITGLVAAVALIWPRALMIPFTTDPNVAAEGATYLRYVALGYVPLAIMFALSGVLRGAGDTIPAALISLTSLWVFRVPMAEYLSSLGGWGARGVWAAIAGSSYVGLVACFIYYRTGRWQSKAVIRRASLPGQNAPGDAPGPDGVPGPEAAA